MEDKHRKKIAGIAFQIFRTWTKNATRYYPDMDFTVLDETELVNDLEQAILKGIKSLQKEEKKEDRGRPGYDYGFLKGFIQGYLNVGWTHEYILKNSDLYRDSIACKAILEYLKFDTETGARINKLYQLMMEKDINLAEIKTDIDEIEVKRYHLDKVNKALQYLEKHNPIYMYLENQLNRHIVAVMDSDRRELMPELESYFGPEFVRELILTYEK